MTLGNHLDNFWGILKKRELADSTLRQRGLQIGYIKDNIGDLLLSRVTIKDVAGMMDSYVHQGKKATAVKLRQILNDAFNEAIVAGHIKDNPVTPTKAPANKVSRSRLIVTKYHQIFEATGDQQQWVKNMFDLAFVTGQRRKDLAAMNIRRQLPWPVRVNYSGSLDVTA